MTEATMNYAAVDLLTELNGRVTQAVERAKTERNERWAEPWARAQDAMRLSADAGRRTVVTKPMSQGDANEFVDFLMFTETTVSFNAEPDVNSDGDQFVVRFSWPAVPAFSKR